MLKHCRSPAEAYHGSGSKLKVYLRVVLGLYRDNGKENGNYYNGLYRDCIGYILGLYWGYIDNGKEDGSYYNAL